MQTKQTFITVGLALLLVALGAGAWFFFLKDAKSVLPFGATTPSAISGGAYTGAPLDADYRNDTFHFALNKPDGFTAGVLPPDDSGATTVILQNKSGDGIQILITPYDDTKVLTASDIQAQIPDLQVNNPEVVEIGNDYKGVAFLSDNAAFGGASREVWFVFHGNLYQISTYARLDGLLKAMFATWKFY